ncbi:MAG: peptide-N-glycosidase, partial [Bacteroidetes bacterium]|nr:peptide-N-glycosidase [Bacteroidota bacterium]
AGDGLEFWYNTAGGRGTLRLLDMQGRCIKAFESDCGDGLSYGFLVQKGAPSPIDTIPVIGLFPARTTGRTVLDYFANDSAAVTVRILDEQKQVVEEHRYTALKQSVFTYDLGYRPPQRYTVQVLANGREVFSRRLRVVAPE